MGVKRSHPRPGLVRYPLVKGGEANVRGEKVLRKKVQKSVPRHRHRKGWARSIGETSWYPYRLEGARKSTTKVAKRRAKPSTKGGRKTGDRPGWKGVADAWEVNLW